VHEGVRGGLPRWFEVALALNALLVTSPVMLAALAAIRLTSRGPAVFKQERIGRLGKPFTLYKFRSMAHGRTGMQQLTASGDVRITSVGRLLRKTKLDELPELWNILRGDMSFVGPRPEVPRYVNLTDADWQTVLSARPGLTDPVTLRLRNEQELLAAVTGDRDLYYRTVLQPYKLRGYQEYLARRTAWSDMGVLLRTVAVVLIPQLSPVPSAEEIERADL
jgi:lipopolysaccharide/colanic/teichoic acid biosynthesis glycosyltransferase